MRASDGIRAYVYKALLSVSFIVAFIFASKPLIHVFCDYDMCRIRFKTLELQIFLIYL